MAVQISILVSNNDDLLSLGYSRIEIWQSIDSGNSYQEITASSPTAAFITSLPAQTTFRMGGKVLKFKIDGNTEFVVSFDPIVQYWSATQVVNRITEVIPGIATDVDDQVVLTSTTTGRASSVEITYSDADDLGFLPGISYGQDNRVPLIPEQTSYVYSDVSGLKTAKYKWRFSNDGVNPVSDFSNPVNGAGVPTVGSGSISVCSATFIGLDGNPSKVTIIVVSDDSPANLSNFIVTSPLPLTFQSDDSGFLQFTLVRNAKVRVAIEGTTFVRAFTVPDAPSFDLLQAMADAPDPYTVQSPPPFLVRRHI